MRHLLVASTLAAAVAAQVPQWVTCPLNGHAYAVMPATTWAQAELFAVSVGGHLATVRNAAEHTWLAQTFGAGSPQDTRMWIGFTDELVEGTWVWSSGEAVTYTNWGLWEPDVKGRATGTTSRSGKRDHLFDLLAGATA
ncbi:MAG: lectin-like protein [Planctomycetota bacterium]